jgi:hypothetical protein
MKIRKEQMEALEQATLKGFEDEMVRHLRDFAPWHAGAVGEPVVREVIRLAIERAARYGLTNRGPVRFYIELMFMFGSDFDTDPLLPWAGPGLADPSVPGQMERADRLHAAMLAYLDQVAGPDQAYALEALRRVDRTRPEDYLVAGRDFEASALQALNDIYPQKCAYLGEPALRAAIRRSREPARRYSADSDLGAALFLGLAFALGHGFDHDPLLPWISRTLSEPRGTDPGRRVERLHARMKVYQGKVLASWGRR